MINVVCKLYSGNYNIRRLGDDNFTGVRQMQTADLQTRTPVSQTSTPVSQTSTPVSQNSPSVRLVRLATSDGNGNTTYNLTVCKSAVCICRTPQFYVSCWYLGVERGCLH